MKHVTVVCEGGWKYTGTQTDLKLSPLGALQWIEIETQNQKILIHSKYIVSIIEYEKRSRKKNN